MRRTISCAALVCWLVFPLSQGLAQHCESYWTAEYKCMQHCGPCPTTNNSNRNYDNGAAERAAAAAEAQRQRDAELEQQRIEAENKRRIEEAEKQAQFINDRDAAAGTLRGSTDRMVSGGPGGSELRGSSATTGSELRGSSAPTGEPGLREISPTTEPCGSGQKPNLNPMVVDARCVPSGLPKSVDDAIASGYSGAPAGVSDRVRKGFQAIATHDWKAARAWFQDALNHDPTNVGLKHLVALADYTEKRVQQDKADKAAHRVRRTPVQLPQDSDIQFLFPDMVPAKAKPSPTPAGQQMQLPKDSDIDFLFPGYTAGEAKALNDYMFAQLLKDVENDPQLIKVSNQLLMKQSNQPAAKQPHN